MATRLAAASRTAAANAITDRLNVGGAGTIAIYSGAQPASADDPPAGTLLVTIPLAAPAFTSGTPGVGNLASTPRTANATATGTAGWARLSDAGSNRVMDVSVTATGAGGDIELSSTAVVSGQAVTLTGGTFTIPAS